VTGAIASNSQARSSSACVSACQDGARSWGWWNQLVRRIYVLLVTACQAWGHGFVKQAETLPGPASRGRKGPRRWARARFFSAWMTEPDAGQLVALAVADSQCPLGGDPVSDGWQPDYLGEGQGLRHRSRLRERAGRRRRRSPGRRPPARAYRPFACRRMAGGQDARLAFRPGPAVSTPDSARGVKSHRAWPIPRSARACGQVVNRPRRQARRADLSRIHACFSFRGEIDGC
jgi:hypothetical protein